MTLAALCDAATVREGLLHILGAGITAVHRESYPAPMHIHLAMMLEARVPDDRQSHQIRIETIDVETGAAIGGVAAQIEQNPNQQPESGVVASIPLVVDMSDSGLPRPGSYEVRIHLDDEVVMTLPFSALILKNVRANAEPVA